MKILFHIATLGFWMALVIHPVMAGTIQDAIDAKIRGDYTTAVRILQPLAEEGDANAQILLGFSYFSGNGVPKNDSLGMKWSRNSADQGNSTAQFLLGYAYQNGSRVPQDYVQAYFWFNLAAAHARTSAEPRDAVAKLMAPDQIAQAQKLSQEWLAAHPQK